MAEDYGNDVCFERGGIFRTLDVFINTHGFQTQSFKIASPLLDVGTWS
jgi:hypothetical protein